MRILTQAILIVSFAIVATGFALVAPDILTIDHVTAYLLGLGLFVALLTVFLLVSQSSSRAEFEDRFANVRHDLVQISETVNKLMTDVDRLSSGMTTGGGRNKELVAEIKVLQTLLSQVAAKRGVSVKPVVSDSSNGSITGSVESTPGTPARGRGEPELRAVEPPGESEIYEIIHNALQDNRVDLYLQPIVSLPSRRAVHYECYSRVRDETGRIIFPSDFMAVAEKSGLVGTLDNLLLFRCIQVVRRLGPRRPGVKFFCNISSSSLNDEEFFPQFMEFMVSNPTLSERLIFELSQSDFQEVGENVARTLMRLGENGFRFSMDHVADLSFDIPGLAQRYFSFVKVNSGILLDGGGDIGTDDLKAAMERFDIELIATKIEQEKTVVEILDHDIDFGQGYLFGEPKPSRQEQSKRQGPATNQ